MFATSWACQFHHGYIFRPHTNHPGSKTAYRICPDLTAPPSTIPGNFLLRVMALSGEESRETLRSSVITSLAVTRALVLSGGGPVGIGWESGLAVGLRNRGVDVAGADAIFGTSAGAFVGAQMSLGEDLDVANAYWTKMRTTVLATSGALSMDDRMLALGMAYTTTALSNVTLDEARRELGRFAIEADVPSEDEFLGYFAVLEGREWPKQFTCTAVDTASGEFVVWRAGSDVDLRHAVAASCAAPCVYPPVTIAGRRYMDGGMRTSLNADLAKGNNRVLVVSATVLSLPPGVSNPVFDGILDRMADELATLRVSGSTVEVIEPNQEFLEISGWGASLMDFDKATEAYEAGVRQGIEESRRIADLWNGSHD